MFNQITIIGVGLIGGSLGLDIKKHKLAKTVVGCGRSDKSLKIARKRKLIDEATLSISDACRNADLIILCAPVFTIIKQLKEVAESAKPGAIVIDAGSTKSEIVQQAQKILPKNIVFVGCHPMAGTENSGPTAAIPNLFKGKKVFITHKNIFIEDVLKVTQFWKKIGAIAEAITPDEHDEIMAAVSHFPQLASYLTVSAIEKLHHAGDLASYIGNGFRDTTRIAASPAEVWIDIILSNKKNILRHLNNLKSETDTLIKLLKKNDDPSISKIKNIFDKASIYRKKF